MGIKSAFWKPHVEGWRDSGLSQAAYCRQRGLDLRRFGYWRRTLGPSGDAAALPALVPITVADAPSAEGRVEVHLPNGLQVRLPIALSPAYVAPLIRALWSC